MRRARRIIILLSAVLVVGLVALVLRTLNAAGLFTDVARVACNDPSVVHGVKGPEDMQYDAASNTVFVSSTDWRAIATHPSALDGIFVFRPGEDTVATRVKGTPADFHPHGLSLIRDRDGKLTLMVVNHTARGTSAIDVFDVDGAGSNAVSLHERESVTGDLLVSPNDVVAVDKDRFYATNDHTSKTALGKWLENWLMLPRANVVYFDGSTFRAVAAGLHFANGINKAPDGSAVYVAETTGREIETYSRNAISGDLNYVNSLPIASGLDNIDVDAKGGVLVAGHPRLFEFLVYAGDPAKASPSQVFRLNADARGVPQAATLLYSGKEIGASSVGIAVRDRLYIGSVFDPKILSCKLAG